MAQAFKVPKLGQRSLTGRGTSSFVYQKRITLSFKTGPPSEWDKRGPFAQEYRTHLFAYFSSSILAHALHRLQLALEYFSYTIFLFQLLPIASVISDMTICSACNTACVSPKIIPRSGTRNNSQEIHILRNWLCENKKCRRPLMA